MGGIRKAAMLLMSLDPATAAELLKSARPETITRLAAEVAMLRSAGARGASPEPAKEFFGLLAARKQGPDFVTSMLQGALGDRSQQVLSQVKQLIHQRDPFMDIREATVEQLVGVLGGESAQVVAMVLAELPAKKSGQVLLGLPAPLKSAAVRGMAGGQDVPAETRLRVAEMVQKRLQEANRAAAAASAAGVAVVQVSPQEKRRTQLRKVAVLLRGLAVELRDAMLKAISEGDEAVGKEVTSLMVIWDDMPLLPDRPLQEILRKVDAKKLALALVGADAAVAAKLRANISERAVALVDEEASLLNKPKPADIESSRETILTALRAINAKGELTFEEPKA